MYVFMHLYVSVRGEKDVKAQISKLSYFWQESKGSKHAVWITIYWNSEASGANRCDLILLVWELWNKLV